MDRVVPTRSNFSQGITMNLRPKWVLMTCLAVVSLSLAALLLGHGPSHAAGSAARDVQWISQAQLQEQGADAAPTQTTTLSDAWNPKNRQGTWLYTLHFEGPDSAAPWGLYLPRVGNRVQVVLNGMVVGQLGTLQGDTSDYAQRPSFFPLSGAVLHPGTNVLELTVQGELARYAGLSSVAVGPYKPVHRLFYWRELIQTQGSFAIVVIAAVFAAASVALAVSLQHRAFLLFGLACVFCAVRTTYALAVDVAPLDYRVWAWLVDTAFAGYLVCMSLFCLEVVQFQRRWVVVATIVVTVATLVLVTVYAFWQQAWARQWWTLMMLVYSLSFSVALVINWWRHPSTPSRVLGVAGLLAVGLGAHDHIQVFYTRDGYGTFALTRYSLLLFMVAMAWVLVDRYQGQHLREQALRDQLKRDLEARTAELVAQFAVQAKLIAATAHEHERQRLVHDLHDGIGLQLNTLLCMAEKTPGQSQWLQEVRTAIDQMRLLVDNSQSFEGTLLELFGHVRHRIDSRLQRLGLRLEWAMNVPDTPGPVNPTKAVALQHLMFELTTNVIKHAQARTMWVSLHPSEREGWLDLHVADDGTGFDPLTAPQGGGSRSLQNRAAELEGTLAVDPGLPGGCRCRLSFPVPL